MTKSVYDSYSSKNITLIRNFDSAIKIKPSANCKKCRGKKEPPLWTVYQGLLLGGRSRAELPGAGEQGSQGGLRSKGSLRGMRSGEGSYSPGGLPYKEENTGSAMIGVQGLRVSS